MIRNGEYRRVLPLNGQVEIIAGKHIGKHGYISDITDGMVQVKSGDEDIYSVCKTSVRLLAPAVVVAEPQPVTLNIQHIIHHITLVGEILNDSDGAGSDITRL